MRVPQRLLHDCGVIGVGAEKDAEVVFECGQREVGDGEGLATAREEPSLDVGL
jgi:hypothetical protein